MTHAERGRRVAQLVRDELLHPSRRPPPLNLDRLAELVESECAGAVVEAIAALDRELLTARRDE